MWGGRTPASPAVERDASVPSPEELLGPALATDSHGAVETAPQLQLGILALPQDILACCVSRLYLPAPTLRRRGPACMPGSKHALLCTLVVMSRPHVMYD
jgi:hypothetical protein